MYYSCFATTFRFLKSVAATNCSTGPDGATAWVACIGRSVAHCRIVNDCVVLPLQGVPLHQCRFSNSDSMMLGMVGQGILKTFKAVDGSLKV